MEEPGAGYCPWGRKELDTTERLHSLQLLSHVQLFSTPGAVACQVPLSMGFSKQEYWSGLSFASLEDLSDPGIKPVSPALQVVSLHSTHQISC